MASAHEDAVACDGPGRRMPLMGRADARLRIALPLCASRSIVACRSTAGFRRHRRPARTAALPCIPRQPDPCVSIGPGSARPSGAPVRCESRSCSAPHGLRRPPPCRRAQDRRSRRYRARVRDRRPGGGRRDHGPPGGPPCSPTSAANASHTGARPTASPDTSTRRGSGRSGVGRASSRSRGASASRRVPPTRRVQRCALLHVPGSVEPGTLVAAPTAAKGATGSAPAGSRTDSRGIPRGAASSCRGALPRHLRP
jgi:hypothetical protein